MSAIRGKVAKILNSREIVLNVGSIHGVREGMLFDVLDPKGEDITDPDTGEILGSVDRPKVRTKITSTQEKISVASTYKSRKINIGGIGTGFITARSAVSQYLTPPKYVTKHETLKTDEKTWEDLDESESYVKTGDPVISVRESPDEPIDVEN